MNRFMVWMVPLILAGCDWFELRDPEAPSQRRSSFEEPIVPETVIDNLRLSFAEANPENFRKCLMESGGASYQFIPSPEFQSIIPVFDVESDVISFKNLMLDLLPDEVMIVEFSQNAPVNQIDSAEWSGSYRLLIPRTSTDYPSRIEGTLILNLRKSPEGLWYIYRWRDFSSPPGYSWSQLKWRFR